MGKVLEAIAKFLNSFGIEGGLAFLVIGGSIAYAVFAFFDIGHNEIVQYSIMLAPLWGPVITFLLFFEMWLGYVRRKFDLNQGRVTLEIALPQEVFKSPEAMELVLMQMHQTAAPDNHVQTYWDGKHPPVYGLELVSREGEVRFYINTPRRKMKNIVEAQLYAQYPGVEVRELPVDYTAEVPWDPDRFSYFSLHFGPKEDDALPIKTYYEYGLHTMPKEEEKVDPLTSMLDALGGIGPGEYYWVQILIEANRKTTFKEGSLGTKPDWRGAAQKYIEEKIIAPCKERSKEEAIGQVIMTDQERDTIKAIERSIGKNAFNTAIRGMYIAKKSSFNGGERIGALITGWRGYDDLNRNAIGVRWRTDFNWNWWQDPQGKKKQKLKKAELMGYKNRRYTAYSYNFDAKKVLTTEELATLFHLPGKVALTPTLGRIPSTRGEAPQNLPVGA